MAASKTSANTLLNVRNDADAHQPGGILEQVKDAVRHGGRTVTGDRRHSSIRAAGAALVICIQRRA